MIYLSEKKLGLAALKFSPTQKFSARSSGEKPHTRWSYSPEPRNQSIYSSLRMPDNVTTWNHIIHRVWSRGCASAIFEKKCFERLFNICRDDQKVSSIFFYFDQLKINIIYIITNTNNVSTSSGCSYYHCFRKFKVALNEKIRKII